MVRAIQELLACACASGCRSWSLCAVCHLHCYFHGICQPGRQQREHTHYQPCEEQCCSMLFEAAAVDHSLSVLVQGPSWSGEAVHIKPPGTEPLR